MAARARKPIGSKDDLTDEEKSALEYVQGKFTRADKLHGLLRPRWNIYYGLYRNYRKLGNDLKRATPRDQDTIIQEFVRTFGAELFIPFVFATIETIAPRVLMNSPKMLALARTPDAEQAIQGVKAVVSEHQEAINYELKLQDVLKSGLLYGLGVGKCYWDEKYRKGKKWEPRKLVPGEHVVDDRKLVYSGPDMEALDIFDFFWDPAAKDMQTADYAIHRTWRTTQYVADRVKAGQWLPLDMERVKGMKSDEDRSEIWGDRMAAAGLAKGDPGLDNLHEVLEFHDREKVYTVLDRCLLVQNSRNPFWHGDLPFQIYRPTRVSSEFCGIGEAEPIAHLQYELNTMRSQRRDAATLALNRGYFYQKGSIQPKDMITGPGAMVPTSLDPREAVYPMPIQDIPSSSVSEEEALKSDITLTTGISETVAGTESPSASTTATSVQLVQAAAGQRIALKTKNFEKEFVLAQTRQFRELYVQKYPRKKRSVRIPDPHTPAGYSFIQVTGKDFENVDLVPEAGSMSPDNEAQKKQDAVQFTQALAPFMEIMKPDEIAKYVIGQYGVKNPERFIQENAPEQGQGPGPGPEGQGQAPDGSEGGPDQLAQMIAGGLGEAGVSPEVFGPVLEQAMGEAESPDEFLQFVGQGLVQSGLPEDQVLGLLEQISSQGVS